LRTRKDDAGFSRYGETMRETITNLTFDRMAVGQTTRLVRSFSQRDADLLGVLMGMPSDGWGGALLALLAGSRWPGPGSELTAMTVAFDRPLKVGDTLETVLTISSLDPSGLATIACKAQDQNGMEVLRGSFTMRAPRETVCITGGDAPDVRINEHLRHRQLIARCTGLKPALTAVVHPCDAASLGAAVEAAKAGLIVPVLVGPRGKIQAVAAAENLDISAFRLVEAPHSHAAAAQAAAMGQRGEVEALMKGSLHTDELMHEVVAQLGTGRRISHVYLFDVTAYPRPLMITDAAINIQPSLSDKRDICQNAIDFAHVLGIAQPRVAILAAVETVSDKMPSTLDAAALCKMAERGQIKGGMLDGPLAFDNAISPEAARTKEIVSPVAGRADILLVPNIEAGNMLAKQLTFFDGADGAGLVLGARLPIILTSRADPPRTRLASAALALLVADARRPA
jgi:phosphotransacetylase/acyl dehydratase